MAIEHLEKIKADYSVFRALCEQLGTRSPAVLAMVDFLGDRLAMAPASSRKSFHNAYPGGLIDHSIRVLKYASKLAKALDLNVSKESLIVSCLFHDLGKVGTDEHDYYLDQESAWHREQGSLYRVNEEIRIKNTGQGALFLLQHFGTKFKIFLHSYAPLKN